VHTLGTQRYTKSMLSAIVTLGGGEITVSEIRKVGVTDLSDPKVQKVVPDLKCSVEINPSTGHKTVSLRSSVRLQVRREKTVFWGVFPMFVPSLSWHNEHFYIYMPQNYRFSAAWLG